MTQQLEGMRPCVYGNLSEAQYEIIERVKSNPDWIESGQFPQNYRGSVLGLVRRGILIEVGRHPMPKREYARLSVYKLDLEALKRNQDFIALREQARAAGVQGWSNATPEQLETAIAKLTTKTN